MEWADALEPKRGGAVVRLRDSTERLKIFAGDVAALLVLLDLPMAA